MQRFAATLNDGRTAARQPVEIALQDGALVLYAAGGRLREIWPLGEVWPVEPPHDGAPLRLACRLQPEARLIVADRAFASVLAAAAPEVFRQKRKSSASMLAFAAGLCVAIIAGLWFGFPQIVAGVARLIPQDWVEPLGRQVARQITRDAPACDGTAGLAALETLSGRLVGAMADPPDFRIEVVDSVRVNAFALPGGRIQVMSGLIKAVETPDELAGVLAHEIGHVAARHPTQALLRYAGLNAVTALLTGNGGSLAGTLAETGGLLLMLSYSRDGEREADRFAAGVMAAAALDPTAQARFFARLKQQDGDSAGGLGYFSTHPALEERIATAGDGSRPAGTAPALSPGAWLALKAICG